MATLPEITRVLTAHPAVRRAETALVHDNGNEVAVAAVEVSEYVSGPVLRNHVWRELGVDSGLAGVLITERISTVDGAVDAQCLAAAVAEGRCTLYSHPRDDAERRLVAIWSARMDVQSVGVDDDFLELGGDSLSALSIIDAVETEFGRPLDVYEFVSAATIRRLAEILQLR